MSDGSQGRRQVARQVRRPDAHDRPPGRLEPCRSFRVARAQVDVVVLAAVDLDGEPHRRVGEVEPVAGTARLDFVLARRRWKAEVEDGIEHDLLDAGLSGPGDVEVPVQPIPQRTAAAATTRLVAQVGAEELRARDAVTVSQLADRLHVATG